MERKRIYEYKPSFILGFHGCDREVGEAVLSGKQPHLKPSENRYDWLGHGVYFWEGNYERAMEWACAHGADPFVIGAVIDLRHCLDLFDRAAIKEVQNTYELLAQLAKQEGWALPRNTGKTPDRPARKLDCMVMNVLLEVSKKEQAQASGDGVEPYDTVRGPFLEGKPIYPDAGFRSQTHIQINVRDPQACIKGYFRPLV